MNTQLPHPTYWAHTSIPRLVVIRYDEYHDIKTHTWDKILKNHAKKCIAPQIKHLASSLALAIRSLKTFNMRQIFLNKECKSERAIM